ncbi:thioredoxin family protein [Spongiimicrobium salis]|uniref:thioredoxin family protein n=1 Tax=Spongiimicrobium salis TaxID=1667022 RepID=UPI00374CBEC1
MMILNRLIFLKIVLFMMSYTGTAQQINTKMKDAQGRTKLLGKINKKGLQQDPFAPWFAANYTGYTVDSAAIMPLKTKLKKMEILAFMGTWCGDSKREVPRFYKILEVLNFPQNKLNMVAVDYMKPNYKKSPGGEEKGWQIIKVPTFIFLKNGKEVNRIVESPIESLEKDMAAIINGARYTPKYASLLKLPQD